MIVEITTDVNPYEVVISCNKPEIINVQPNEPINIRVDMTRDGVDGKSAYQSAYEINPNIGTEEEWIDSLGSNKNFIKNEIPIGELDGLNTVFLSQNEFVPESVEVFLNGIFQQKIAEFQTSLNNTITLNISPNPGETLLINYQKL